MNNRVFVKLALTSVAITLPTMGCTQIGVTSASSAAPAKNATAVAAHANAKKAEKLMAKGKNDQALTYAEMAVEGDMRNLDYRALLARAYMADGRFASAERTLMDVMELGQSDPRTVVSLALARIAQGKVDSAIALVDANRAILPASDYGLALALAGDNKRAIEVLTNAIRDNNATARTRQNLALAYALNSNWREAQVMALQDMPQESVDKNLVQWAQFARPDAYEMRVASLLGVTPKADAGQPTRLALINAPVENVQVAAVEPVQPESSLETAIASIDPSAELAATGPAPGGEENVRVAAVAAPAPAAEAPLIKAPEGPAKSDVKVAATAKPVKLALAETAPATPKAVSGSHLVQLGAFSSVENAQRAWTQLKARHGVLAGFSSASSTVTVNGKQLIRLAAMGFGNYQAANAACSQIKAKGGVCIVRNSSGEAQPVRMAAARRKPVRVASR